MGPCSKVMPVDIDTLLISLSIDNQSDDNRQMKYDHESARKKNMHILMHNSIYYPKDAGAHQQDPGEK